MFLKKISFVACFLASAAVYCNEEVAAPTPDRNQIGCYAITLWVPGIGAIVGGVGGVLMWAGTGSVAAAVGTAAGVCIVPTVTAITLYQCKYGRCAKGNANATQPADAADTTADV